MIMTIDLPPSLQVSGDHEHDRADDHENVHDQVAIPNGWRGKGGVRMGGRREGGRRGGATLRAFVGGIAARAPASAMLWYSFAREWWHPQWLAAVRARAESRAMACAQQARVH